MTLAATVEKFAIVGYDDATTLRKDNALALIHATGVVGTTSVSDLETAAGVKIKAVLVVSVKASTRRGFYEVVSTVPKIRIYSIGATPEEVTSGANLAVDILAVI